MGVTARDMEERQRRTLKMAEKLVESTMAGRDASHDAAHAFRVRDLALSLAMEDGLDNHSLEIDLAHILTNGICESRKPRNSYLDALPPNFCLLDVKVEIAALLHDIGDYKYSKDLVENTSIVENFLNEEGLEESKRHKILGIIKGMGFKNEVAQIACGDSSLEFGVVQDADRLDAIGAIGIARCFTYGGSKNRILHDPQIPPRQNLSKENYINKSENQTTINHFHEKLFKLKDMMKTEAGRKRAEKRHDFMVDFIEEFYEEWSGRT